MEGLRLDDLERALTTKDASLVDMIVALANASDPAYDDAGEAYTIHSFRAEVNAWNFGWKEPDEQRSIRVEGWKRLESDDADVELPDRYSIYEIVEELHESEGAFARETLLEVIRRAPIRWGVWRGLKRLFKNAEKSGDLELYGALLARIDTELSNTWGDFGEVSRRTLTYLARRGWRHLRTIGTTFEAAYVETASAVLREYPENTSWNRTWVANHIFFHNYEFYGERCYRSRSFRFWSAPDTLTEHRAFSALWRDDSRPLFALLERARSERVRAFAIAGLREDYRAELRELGQETILQLIQVNSATVHDFAVWLLDASPKFDQVSFRDVGLHEPVLSLLDSPGYNARVYAVEYARTHARDLSIVDLIRLANHSDETVRKLAIELLGDHDPRLDIGIHAWTELLGSDHAHALAVEMLDAHFGARELDLAWFRARFLNPYDRVHRFAIERFATLHEVKSVSADYFVDLIEAEDVPYAVTQFAIEALDKRDPAQFDVDVVRRLLVFVNVGYTVRAWISEGLIEAASLGVDYWRALAYKSTWDASEWASKLITSGPAWAQELTFDSASTAHFARELLVDERSFAPAQVGLEWLLSIVDGRDEDARDWARKFLFEAFSPADFAEDGADSPELDGCERIFEMAVGDESSRSLADFARQYLRLHHDALSRELSDTPVDEDHALPDTFVTFERFRPLLVDSRLEVRRMALDFARWEMARWSPSIDAVLELCESRRDDVQTLFNNALLAEDTPENSRIRIAPETVDRDGVYRLCDSTDRGTRSLGIKMIERYPELRDPTSLFGLSDNPDRRVRSFVIKMIWSLYRERGVTQDWQPAELDTQYPSTTEGTYERGPGVPDRPLQTPANADELRQFLRRILFGLPPARPPRGQERGEHDPPPVPARRAKLYLLEVMRDLALDDPEFATIVRPLLEEFVHTLGKSERGACLVALARLDHKEASQ